MLPHAEVIAHAQIAPWPTLDQVEQDLVLRSLAAALADDPVTGPDLVGRGGTFMNMLAEELLGVTPQRFSEDLDDNRLSNTPIGPVADAVRRAASLLVLRDLKYRDKSRNYVQWFEYDAIDGGTTRVKVEVNKVETTPALDVIVLPLTVTAGRPSVAVRTFRLEELLGTKLRALHQRRKGRDVFDLWLGLRAGADPATIVAVLDHYLAAEGNTITAAAFTTTLTAKLNDRTFLSDIDALLVSRPDGYDINSATNEILEVFTPLLAAR